MADRWRSRSLEVFIGEEVVPVVGKELIVVHCRRGGGRLRWWSSLGREG
jgi:hypothetical protein